MADQLVANELDVLLVPLEQLREHLCSSDNKDWYRIMVPTLKHRPDYIAYQVGRIDPGATWRRKFLRACRAAGYRAVWNDTALVGMERLQP